jgi:O-antigen/teichoic acid export membrane protein
MSFRKSLFKNVIIIGGYSYSSQIISFLSSIILSRLLLPAEYGFVALISVFTGFIGQFADAGLSYLIIRSDYKKLFYSVMNYLSFIIGVILCVIVLLLAYPIALFYKDNALILPTVIMSLSFIFRSLIIIPYGILSKELKFNSLGLIDLVCSVAEILMMIIFAYLKFSYWALILPNVLGSFIRIAFFYSYVSLPFRFMKMKYLIVGFRMARGIIGNLTGSNVLNYFARNTDNLIIGKYYGTQSLGIYSRAYKMLELAISVMTSLFGKVLLPSLKKHADEGGDVKKEYMNTLGIISLLNYPAAVILIFFSEPIVRILWSQTWIQVAEFLPYIGILILTQTLNSTTGNIFILYGKENMLMRISIPTNIIIVGAIAFGSLFSVVHVLRYYTLAFIIIDLPFVCYYGFKKSFGYETKNILLFWIPKIVLSTLMVFSVWHNNPWITAGLMLLYLVHLIIDQKDDIWKTFNFVLNKISPSKNNEV